MSRIILRRGRSYLRLGIAIVLVVVLTSFGTLWYCKSLLAPVAKGDQPVVMVEVPNNSTSSTVANMLEDKGLIKSALAFRGYSRYMGLDSKIQVGEYPLNASMSTPEILQVLIQGNQIYFSFTVPEGYTVEQIAALLAERGHVREERFLQLANQGDYPYPFLKKHPDIRYILEGYLFPDTYQITRHDNEETIIEMMLERFMQEIENIGFAQKAETLGLTVHEAVSIAAMIEREAVVPQERTVISGVIHNRIKIGMPLQIDATVLYALGEHKEVVLYKDLEVKSPYNTYYVSGLPVGPIASPGAAALRAAVEPQNNHYLYYVAKPDGSHAFSRTLAEHNRNKAKYLP